MRQVQELDLAPGLRPLAETLLRSESAASSRNEALDMTHARRGCRWTLAKGYNDLWSISVRTWEAPQRLLVRPLIFSASTEDRGRWPGYVFVYAW